MPFDNSALQVLADNMNQRLYSYETADTVSQVLAPGYFPRDLLLRHGEQVFVEASDANATLVVSRDILGGLTVAKTETGADVAEVIDRIQQEAQELSDVAVLRDGSAPMLAPLPINAAPTAANHAARKQEVDAVAAVANAALPATQKGSANGVAPLDANSRLAQARLPTQVLADEYTGGRGGAAPAVNASVPFFRNPLSDGSSSLLGYGDWYKHTDASGGANIAMRHYYQIGTTYIAGWEANPADNLNGFTIKSRAGWRLDITNDGQVLGPVAPVVNVKDKKWAGGAKGDGTTDDTAAIQAAVDYIRASMTYGSVLYFPPGRYVVRSRLYIWMNKCLIIRGSGRVTTTIAFTDMAVNDIGFAATNSTTPTTRSPGLVFDNISVSAVGTGSGPVLLESLYASNLDLINTRWTNYLGNTVLRVGSMFNCRWYNNMVWGGGVHRVRKLTPANITFSINKDDATRTLTASADVFEAGDVGKRIFVSGQMLTVSSVSGPRTAIVDRQPYQTVSAGTAVYEAVTGSMAAGAFTMTVNAARFSAADVGRVIWVLDCMGTTSTARRPLRTTITAVSSDGLTLTLADKPDNAVTDGVIFVSPAVEIIGGDLKNTNDIILHALHLEEVRGVGLAINDALNVRMTDCKVHALGSNAVNDATTMISVVCSNVHGRYTGDLEGIAHHHYGRVYVSGQSTGLKFAEVDTVFGDGIPFLTTGRNHPSGYVEIGDLFSANQVSQPTISGAVVNLDSSCPVEITGAIRGAYATTTSTRAYALPISFAQISAASLPGPFANDAAAGSGGVAQGMVYRTTAGGLAFKL